MHAEQVDERDNTWEDPSPRFRVYIFERPHDSEYGSTDTWDLTGGDVLEALRWAQDRAGADGLYSLALVRDATNRGDLRRGLVWLVGMDWFEEPCNGTDERRKAAMVARRGTAVVRPEPE